MLSTKVKEDATKNRKFHIPFSWIKFHHIDKSENEDATKTNSIVANFGKNNAKTTPCQYCNNIFDRK